MGSKLCFKPKRSVTQAQADDRKQYKTAAPPGTHVALALLRFGQLLLAIFLVSAEAPPLFGIPSAPVNDPGCGRLSERLI